MAYATGDRCGVYTKIDELAEARTVAELAARLRPILNELAYYAVTGEAAVMETQEEWHGEFTDRLYGAAAADTRQAGAPSPHGAGQAPPRAARRAPGPRAGDEKARAAHAAAVNGRNPAPVAPPANRPRPGDLPPSLRAIMEGSHPSLRDDEGYSGL